MSKGFAMQLIKKGSRVQWQNPQNRALVISVINSSETIKDAADALNIDYEMLYKALSSHYEEESNKFRVNNYSYPELLEAIKTSSNAKEVASKIGVGHSGIRRLIDAHYPQYYSKIFRPRITKEKLIKAGTAKGTKKEVAKKHKISINQVVHARRVVKALSAIN